MGPIGIVRGFIWSTFAAVLKWNGQACELPGSPWEVDVKSWELHVMSRGVHSYSAKKKSSSAELRLLPATSLKVGINSETCRRASNVGAAEKQKASSA